MKTIRKYSFGCHGDILDVNMLSVGLNFDFFSFPSYEAEIL